MALGRAAKHEGQADLDNPVQSIRLKALFNIVDSCLIFLMCFIVWDRYQILNGYSCKPETWRTLLELSKVAAEKSRQSNQLVLAGLWYGFSLHSRHFHPDPPPSHVIFFFFFSLFLC